MRTSTPWIIRLSLHIYRRLFSMGPATYRAEYEEPTLQVFRQCCRDAYRQRGMLSVLRLWLPMFSEVAFGMLAEHFSMLRCAYERIGQMLPTMRRSMIITLCSFIFFAVSYIFLMRITDPRAPLDIAASMHPAIGISFIIINWSAQIAFLVVVLGGLPILFSAIKYAIIEKSSNPLLLFVISRKQFLMLISSTIALEIVFFAFLLIVQFISGGRPSPQQPITPLSPLEIAAQLGIVTLFTFVILAIPLFIAQAILRSAFSVRMLRYALILMVIAALAMATACIATITWIISLWIAAPDIANSQGLGLAGLRGGIGGSEGVVIVVAMMVVGIAGTVFALRRGIRAKELSLI